MEHNNFERDKVILEGYYRGKTFEKMGEECGISKQAVYQRFYKMRKLLEERGTTVPERNRVPIWQIEAFIAIVKGMKVGSV